MKKKLTWQDKNRIRTERAEKLANARTVFIEGLTHAESEHLRTRIFHSCASGGDDGYIATYALMLPLAIQELSKLRRKPARVKVDRHGFHLSTR